MQREKLYSREEYIKKIENNGISVMELVKFVLSKWKMILILFAIFYLGCIGIFFLGVSETEESVPPVESEEQLTESQQEKVNEIISENKKETEAIEVLEKYNNTLAYMDIDPYMCHVNTLQYLINSEVLGGEIYEAYRTYAVGGLKKTIDEKLGGEFVSPSDLVTEVGTPSQVDNQALFKDKKSYVLLFKVVAADADMNEKITDAVKNSLEEYRKHLLSTLGEHELILLSESGYVGSDEGVRQRQLVLEEEIEKRKARIINNESVLDENEKAFLEELKNKDNANDIQDETVTLNEEQGIGAVWYFMALVVCLILSCIVVVCYYVFVFGNRLKSGEEIMSIFDLPYVGEVSKKDLQAGILSLQDEIKNICLKTKSKELFISLMTNVDNIEEYFDKVKAELENNNVKLLFGNNISDDFESMKMVRHCKNMILIVEEGKTSYRSLDSVLQRCDNWGINIIGVINLGNK